VAAAATIESGTPAAAAAAATQDTVSPDCGRNPPFQTILHSCHWRIHQACNESQFLQHCI
jgi:hypothetical protein